MDAYNGLSTKSKKYAAQTFFKMIYPYIQGQYGFGLLRTNILQTLWSKLFFISKVILCRITLIQRIKLLPRCIEETQV